MEKGRLIVPNDAGCGAIDATHQDTHQARRRAEEIAFHLDKLRNEHRSVRHRHPFDAVRPAR
ncbi:MAG TPA: hypothetical protein VN607_01995, partial [Gemmatimonadaceae bacterium]|nr:hypothetical protein [Gemmatimonadaceae bacterium]